VFLHPHAVVQPTWGAQKHISMMVGFFVGAELAASKIQDATHTSNERKPRSVLEDGGQQPFNRRPETGWHKFDTVTTHVATYKKANHQNVH